ncbi:MRN complex-interacting protein [Cuculus canorus]|uniref:MRN complex-interacting protein n=1 Tax=Cuculus canorus TaxID=55661 RepID=UPI0023AAA8D1|nr:MRN complex-interacting protein [Cuculus canorus]
MATGGMAVPRWVLRCCSCLRFQVQQAKRSGKWSCSVCGQRQTVQKVYGQGSGLDCRRHVQKLNLLQGEAEEAIGWTFRYIEESINDSKNTGAQHEDSLVQQEGRAEVSRWSKYLDKESENQEDGEEAAGTERHRFCSQRKNTVEEQRRLQKSFLSSDVQEYTEEHGVFQLSYQVKKRKKCLVAMPDQDDGDALSGDSMVPAVCESIVPGDTTQTPALCTKPSKWEKFLSCSDSYSRSAARVTLLPQEGGGTLGLPSTTAAGAGVDSICSEQAGRTLPPGTGFEFKKHVASTEQVALKLPGTPLPSSSCSVVEEVLKEPLGQLLRVGSGVSETTAGRRCLDSPRRADNLADYTTRPKPSNVSRERLFCTGDEFDDDI